MFCLHLGNNLVSATGSSAEILNKTDLAVAWYAERSSHNDSLLLTAHYSHLWCGPVLLAWTIATLPIQQFTTVVPHTRHIDHISSSQISKLCFRESIHCLVYSLSLLF